jgi:hypothetical protein
MQKMHDQRSGLDRRSGNDRRMDYSRFFFSREMDRRKGIERRNNEEARKGWVRVSKFNSAYIGIPVKALH